ncbi:S8 family peptidase [Streptomyces sp. NA04227]|nr:S8 family peptidase [Streptomyces sp. NA04227]
MKTRRRLISVAVASAALLGGTALYSTATANPAESGDREQVAAESADVAPTGARLIVGYKSKAAEARSNKAAAVAGSDVGAKSNRPGFERRLGTGAVLYDLGAKTSKAQLDAALEEFRANPDVAYAELDSRAYATAGPDDTEYQRQWDLFEDTAGMKVEPVWSKYTGKDVTVAVIDTGYVKHSDLDGNIVKGYDFISDAEAARDQDGRDDDASDEGDWYEDGECQEEKGSGSSWHGTHVAGTIAASTNNGKGIAGIAYNAKVQPVRVLGKCGGATSDIVDAITWASGGKVAGVPANPTPAKVINMSLGGAGSCSQSYQRAIDGAVKRGTTVVVSAGNSDKDSSQFTPASCGNVINVAASSREGNKAFYSNFGESVDIAAPGGETRRETDTPGTVTTPENGIWSTLNDGKSTPGAEIYKPYQGTSMAAPHIAGLAALLKEAKPDLTPAQVEQAIKDSARALPGKCDEGCGAGLADAEAALNGKPAARR